MDQEKIFLKFEEAILSKGYSVFIPDDHWNDIKMGEAEVQSFGGCSSSMWRRPPEQIKNFLKEVKAKKQQMVEPDFTDYEQWKILEARYSIRYPGPRKPVCLYDGSVAKFWTITIDAIWDRKRVSRQFFPDDVFGSQWVHLSEGRIVFMRYRYHLAHLRNLRRKIEDVLRKNPDRVVQAAELFGIK